MSLLLQLMSVYLTSFCQDLSSRNRREYTPRKLPGQDSSAAEFVNPPHRFRRYNPFSAGHPVRASSSPLRINKDEISEGNLRYEDPHIDSAAIVHGTCASRVGAASQSKFQSRA